MRIISYSREREMKIVSEVSKALMEGKVVIYPTETVYGIGAKIDIEESVKKVFEIKKRKDKPLSIALHSVSEIKKYAYENKLAKALAREFLPGPLTLVLKKKETVPDYVTCNLNEVGIRIPEIDFIRRIIRKTGAITSTSANLSGNKSPCTLSEAISQISADIAIDYGRTKYCKESTVIRVHENSVELLREGVLKFEEIKKFMENNF